MHPLSRRIYFALLLLSSLTPKEVVFWFCSSFCTHMCRLNSKGIQDVIYSLFLLFIEFPSNIAMMCSTLSYGQWGVAVWHLVSYEGSFKTVLGYNWLQFTLMMLIFEQLIMIQEEHHGSWTCLASWRQHACVGRCKIHQSNLFSSVSSEAYTMLWRLAHMNKNCHLQRRSCRLLCEAFGNRFPLSDKCWCWIKTQRTSSSRLQYCRKVVY